MMNNAVLRTLELCLLVGMAGFSGVLADRIPAAIALEAEPNSALSLEETSWQFSGWGDNRIRLAGTSMTLKFKGDRINGSAGCNGYTAIYQSSEDRISIRRVATTRMACPGEMSQQESRYLAALQNAMRFAINDRGELEIFYHSDRGIDVLTFAEESRSEQAILDKAFSTMRPLR